MIENIRQLALLSKIFNLKRNEFSRILPVWLIRMCYQVGFVLGWTVLVVIFTSNYGITALPILFILNAIFTIIGSFFYLTLLDRIKGYKIMAGSLLIAGILLYFAARFTSYNLPLSVGLIIVVIAVFLSQFRILLFSYIEERFTPLESERIFPVIEGADTIGGVLGGLIVLSFSRIFELSSFLYLWQGILFIIVAVLLLNERVENVFNVDLTTKSHHIGIIGKIRNTFSKSKHMVFVRGMFLIVFLQWFIYNLLEFQYTRAVFKNVSAVVLQAGTGFEHVFVHDLGVLFVFFSLSSLLVQFFFGGRLVSYLGVVGTMLVHGLLTLFSVLGLTFYYNYNTAVLAKNNFTVGSVLFNASYHSSYYAIDRELRSHIRELLEGFVRPIGAIFGTMVLILMEYVFAGKISVWYVNMIMLWAILFFVFVTKKQQTKYTDLALAELNGSASKAVRMDAVDILAQKGHRDVVKSLKKILYSSKEEISLRIKIVHALEEINTESSLSVLINSLKSKEIELKRAVLASLSMLAKRSNGFKGYEYKKYKLVVILQDLYDTEPDSETVSNIIDLMSRMSSVATLEFLDKILRSSKSIHKAEAIYALRGYNDDGLVKKLLLYLNSSCIDVKINAAIVLYQFSTTRQMSISVINDFLNSRDETKCAYGLFAIGELKMSKFKNLCLNQLVSSNLNVKINSAIALLKLGIKDGIPILVNIMLRGDKKATFLVKRLLKNVDVHIFRNIDSIVAQAVSFEIKNLINSKASKDLNSWEKEEILRLKWLYTLSEDFEEVELIDKFLLHFN